VPAQAQDCSSTSASRSDALATARSALASSASFRCSSCAVASLGESASFSAYPLLRIRGRGFRRLRAGREECIEVGLPDPHTPRTDTDVAKFAAVQPVFQDTATANRDLPEAHGRAGSVRLFGTAYRRARDATRLISSRGRRSCSRLGAGPVGRGYGRSQPESRHRSSGRQASVGLS